MTTRKDRQKKYEKLMRAEGVIPPKVGAGDLVERLYFDDPPVEPFFEVSPRVECWSTRGDQSSVAGSYGYPVIDHYVDWYIPCRMIMRVIHGVVTVGYAQALCRERVTPARCWWPVKGPGYSGRWVAGWLYHGVHVRSETAAAARKKIDRDRARSAADLRARRQTRSVTLEALRRVWVDRASLLRAGACAPGIEAARKKIEAMVGATGEIGAIRADWLAQSGDKKYSSFAFRVASRRRNNSPGF